MKNLTILLFCFIFFHSLCAQHPQNDPNWTIVFEDSFNFFNDSIWYKEEGFRQSGTPTEDIARILAANAYTDRGKLYLRVKRDTSFHAGNCYYHDQNAGYLIFPNINIA